MALRKRGNRRGSRGIEDTSNWRDIPRTEEVKHYSRGVRQLVKRSTLTGLLGLLIGVFIGGSVIYAFGIPGTGAGSATNAEGRHMFVLGAAAMGLLILYFAIPLAIKIYRSRWVRVSEFNDDQTQQLERTG